MAFDRQGDDMKNSSTSPHFFKIILEDTLRINKLQIPPRIVRKYGGTISNPVFLKLPCGSHWMIGLTKSSDGKVWIDKGWPEFVDHYSLVHGHLLVFRYAGNSQFNVLIFDKSTVEIDYPSNPSHFHKHDIERQAHHESLVKEDTHEEDDFVEILESFPSSAKRKEKSPIESSRPRKIRRTNPLGEIQTNQSHPRAEECLDFLDKELGGEKSNNPPKWRKCGDISKQRLTGKEKAQALKRVGSFKSKHPFFMVAMQPSFVGAWYMVNFPSVFATKYLRSKKAKVMLKIPEDNRIWSVMYTFGVYNRISRARFVNGWREFAWDNDLKVGDVCVFVLTKSIPTLFEVSIFRQNARANSNLLPVHKAAATFEVGPRGCLSSKVESRNTMISKSARAVERANIQSTNPSFTVIIRASHANYNRRFHIPNKFAKAHITKNEGKAILEVQHGRSWSIRYQVRQRSNWSPVAEFCQGWIAFARDNSLEEGDICTFELIRGDDFLFEVSIVKAQDHLTLAEKKATKPVKAKRNASDYKLASGCTRNNETNFSLKPIIKKEQDEIIVVHADAGKFRKIRLKENSIGDRVHRRPSIQGVQRASEVASKFFSKNPYFQVVFTSRLLERNKLYLPLSFAKSTSCFEEKSQIVTLQVGETSWPVKLLACPLASTYMFSSGWSAFARENSLCPGDVCIFELIKMNRVLLKVSIFRETR